MTYVLVGLENGKNMAEKKKEPIGKIVLIVVVVFVALGAFGSLSGGDTKGSCDTSTSAGAAKTEQTEEKKPEQEPYTISDETLDTSNPYGVKITGTLVNNTDEDKSYLQIEYNLYDADGAQIGTALANINNLKAGGTWKFEATSMEKPEDVASGSAWTFLASKKRFRVNRIVHEGGGDGARTSDGRAFA